MRGYCFYLLSSALDACNAKQRPWSSQRSGWDTASATNLNTSIPSSWIDLLFVLLIGGVLIGGGLGLPTRFRGLDLR